MCLAPLPVLEHVECGFGRRDPSRLSFEQDQSQFLLQQRYLACDDRWCGVERIRRTADRSVYEDLVKVPQSLLVNFSHGSGSGECCLQGNEIINKLLLLERILRQTISL